MKKAIILLLGLLLTGNVLAEEAVQEKESLFETLRKKIELLTPKKKLQTTTAVGGVRGSKADANDLYWKGEEKEGSIDAQELAAFDDALSQAEAGDMAAAEEKLAAFVEQYPQSQLREDAEKALAAVRDARSAPSE